MAYLSNMVLLSILKVRFFYWMGKLVKWVSREIECYQFQKNSSGKVSMQNSKNICFSKFYDLLFNFRFGSYIGHCYIWPKHDKRRYSVFFERKVPSKIWLHFQFCFFWPILKSNMYRSKKVIKTFIRFKIFYQKSFEWLTSILQNICLNFSILQFWHVYQSRYDQVWVAIWSCSSTKLHMKLNIIEL